MTSDWRRGAFTLLFAIAGGIAASALNLPVGWLLGSMLAVAVAGALGFRTDLPGGLRTLALFLLGLQAGASVTPQVAGQIALWPLSFALQTLGVLLVIAVTYWFLHRVCAWDRQTSLFAALPGAMSLVVAAASETRADMTKVTVVQTARVLLLIAGLTPVLAALQGNLPQGIGLRPGASDNTIEFLLLGAACVLGAALGHRSGLPGGMMLGALVVSAALHLSTVVSVSLPAEAMIPALIVLGALVGSRLRPEDRSAFAALLLPTLGAFALALIASGLAVLIAAWVLGLELATLSLAYAPGALEALTVLAVQFERDPAFVAAHHVFRFICIALAVPFLGRWLGRRDARAKKAGRT